MAEDQNNAGAPAAAYEPPTIEAVPCPFCDSMMLHDRSEDFVLCCMNSCLLNNIRFNNVLRWNQQAGNLRTSRDWYKSFYRQHREAHAKTAGNVARISLGLDVYGYPKDSLANVEKHLTTALLDDPEAYSEGIDTLVSILDENPRVVELHGFIRISEKTVVDFIKLMNADLTNDNWVKELHKTLKAAQEATVKEVKGVEHSSQPQYTRYLALLNVIMQLSLAYSNRDDTKACSSMCNRAFLMAQNYVSMHWPESRQQLILK